MRPWAMPAAAALLITHDDLAGLRRWARCVQLPAVLVQRARILLLAADGVANTEIARRVGVSRPTVIACRRRYVRRGLDGLPDRPRPGRPQTVRRLRRAQILAVTLTPPPARLGITHWSTRLLARELGVSRDTIARVWREYGVQPCAPRCSSSPPTRNWSPRSTTSSGSTCTHPTARSCCASMRSPRSKPWSASSPCATCGRDAPSSAPTTTPDMAPPPCSPRWRSRPGASPTDALPATATRNSSGSSSRSPEPTHAGSCNWCATTTPPTSTPRSAPGSPATPASSCTSPPTSASWLNLVEVFFSIVECQALRRGDFTSVTDLTTAISHFCTAWNQHCQPFSWTKSADEILTKLNRQTTSATQH
jgi:transposase